MRKKGIFMLVMLMAGMLSACGKEPKAEAGEVRIVENDAANEQKTDDTDDGTAGIPDSVVETDTGENLQSDQWKQQFGENCISEQTVYQSKPLRWN